MTAPAPVTRLVEALIHGRLLLAEEAGGQATVTLAHEALLQEWPALHEWLERHRAQIQSIERLLLGLAADEQEDRKHAAQRLAVIGSAAAEASPKVVPALVAALGDADAGVRWAAAGVLGRIGPAAAEASPKVVLALVAALGDADAYVRQAAAEALGRIGSAATEAVPALVAALRDANAYVRRGAAAVLKRIRSPSA